ncbi:hypothetical protein Peur_022003 [Populus x canadensis]
MTWRKALTSLEKKWELRVLHLHWLHPSLRQRKVLLKISQARILWKSKDKFNFMLTSQHLCCEKSKFVLCILLLALFVLSWSVIVTCVEEICLQVWDDVWRLKINPLVPSNLIWFHHVYSVTCYKIAGHYPI